MNAESPNLSKPEAEEHEKLVCFKCRAINAPGRHLCSTCGAHLHIVCKNCKHRNHRVDKRCANCGEKLHRGKGVRKPLMLQIQRGRITLSQVFLLALGIIAAALVLWGIANYVLPLIPG